MKTEPERTGGPTEGDSTPMTELHRDALDALSEYIWFGKDGGYEPVINGSRIPDWVVVADVDDNDRPTLSLITWENLLAWYHRALDMQETDEDMGIGEAMLEEADEHDFEARLS